jgi:hypothetical protein
MKSVPNWIFYLHEFSRIFPQFLAISSREQSNSDYLISDFAAVWGPPVSLLPLLPSAAHAVHRRPLSLPLSLSLSLKLAQRSRRPTSPRRLPPGLRLRPSSTAKSCSAPPSPLFPSTPDRRLHFRRQKLLSRSSSQPPAASPPEPPPPSFLPTGRLEPAIPELRQRRACRSFR